MKNIDRALLYFHTLRYLKPAQIWYRALRILRKRCWQISGRQIPQPFCRYSYRGLSYYPGLADIRHPGPWSNSVADPYERALGVAEQHFDFLNHSVRFNKQLIWNNPNLNQLWRYHLHYFDYVNDLIIWFAAGEPYAAYQAFRSLTSSWIEHNQNFEGDGWHPFTISVRIVNWLIGAMVFDRELEDDRVFCQKLMSSIFGQTQVLYNDLEFDVRGNHILKNIRALLFSGLSFDDLEPQRWYRRAYKLLAQELSEQVLADGGHFERSPGYHLAVLRDCLEIALLLDRNNVNSPKWLDEALHRMLDYLISVLPLDGRVPLLKDTVWSDEVKPIDLLTAGALYFNEPAYKLSNDLRMATKSCPSHLCGFKRNRLLCDEG
jgi:hypothetical protein